MNVYGAKVRTLSFSNMSKVRLLNKIYNIIYLNCPVEDFYKFFLFLVAYYIKLHIASYEPVSVKLDGLG